jgi:hypothetical protein
MKNNKWVMVLLGLVLAAALAGCSAAPAATAGMMASANTSAVPADSNWTIEIQGGTKSSITAADFAGLKSVTLTATLNHMGTSVTSDYTGVLFMDVLKFAGVGDYTSVKIVASDSYEKDYKPADLNNDKTLFATAKNKVPLTTDDGPVMLVPSALTGNFWVKHVAKIIITK